MADETSPVIPGCDQDAHDQAPAIRLLACDQDDQDEEKRAYADNLCTSFKARFLIWKYQLRVASNRSRRRQVIVT